MPIVATSPPIIFGGDDTNGAPTRTPVPRTPSPKTPGPPIHSTSDFVTQHQSFIQQVDNLNNCFKKESIINFTKTELEDHLQIAMIDKYLTQNEDMYCTMQGVKNLSNKLKRFID